jgi:drug/metabolite transporter (DMT)-like permease
MMLGGFILLAVSLSAGDLAPLPHVSPKAVLALAYMIVFGSLIAYTSYVWLLGRFSVTRVSSHAYVNPVVAIVIGHFVAGEIITGRSVAAAALIMVSVFLLLSGPASGSPGSTIKAVEGA